MPETPSEKAARLKYRRANKEKINAKQRAWRAANKDKVQKWNAARDYRSYYLANRKHLLEQKRIHARRKAGCIDATGETEKHGTCPICERNKKLVYDHDHITGKHRGWLCTGCNWHLGWYELFQPEIINYLGHIGSNSAG